LSANHAGSDPSLDVDLFTQENLASPWQPLRRMAEEDPIFWSSRMQAWVLTRHADVKAAYADRRLSAARLEMYLRFLPPGASEKYAALIKSHRLNIVFLDPPAHMRIRTLVMKAFTRPEVEKMLPIIDGISEDILARCAELREFDYIEEVSSVLPTRVIQGMLGVPEAYTAEFFSLAATVIRAMGSALPSPELMADANSAIIRLNEVLRSLIEERRKQPGHDVLSALVQARDSGDRLSDDELMSACTTIVEAGAETTAHMLGIALHEIAQRPELTRLVQTGVEEALKVVDELLRFPSLVKGMTRIVAEPFVWHGRSLQRGDLAFMMNCAANVDPAVFERPFEIDPTRSQRDSLAFGPGFHSCIGSFLARAELSNFLHGVFRRFHVTVPEQDLRFVKSFVFRGYERLKVRFDLKSQAA
jgi:cytochrome P450 PksS